MFLFFYLDACSYFKSSYLPGSVMGSIPLLSCVFIVGVYDGFNISKWSRDTHSRSGHRPRTFFIFNFNKHSLAKNTSSVPEMKIESRPRVCDRTGPLLMDDSVSPARCADPMPRRSALTCFFFVFLDSFGD